MLQALSLLRLQEAAQSEQNKRAFRSPTPQLVAFASIIVAYVLATEWKPTQNQSDETRRNLRGLGLGLGLQKTVYEAFIGSVRRIAQQICSSEFYDREEVKAIRCSANEEKAVSATVNLLVSLEIFTPAHMRIWAAKDSLEPLDHTRRTGDASRYRARRSTV